MNMSTLKLIVVLDPETHGFKPSAHNLTPDEAVDIATHFMARNRAAKVLDQEKRHRAADATKCRACKKAAEENFVQSESDRHETTRDAAASEG